MPGCVYKNLSFFLACRKQSKGEPALFKPVFSFTILCLWKTVFPGSHFPEIQFILNRQLFAESLFAKSTIAAEASFLLDFGEISVSVW